jgi:hypothetical protein
MPVKPDTQKETIDQLWYAIMGTTNGDGIVGRIERLESRPRSRWLMAKDVLLILIPVIVLAHTLGFI